MIRMLLATMEAVFMADAQIQKLATLIQPQVVTTALVVILA
jgi:hypothetical protein